jgi:hypothetical protein
LAALPQAGSPAQQVPAAGAPAVVDRLAAEPVAAADPAAAADRAAAGTGVGTVVETAVETVVETVGGTAVGTVGGTAAARVINVGFSGEHDFAAQDGILTRPFARLLSSSDVAS